MKGRWFNFGMDIVNILHFLFNYNDIAMSFLLLYIGCTKCLIMQGFSLRHSLYHRVYIFTRDETGLVYLPTQLERTLQHYW
jgi:hypothetical protein